MTLHKMTGSRTAV